MDSPVGGLRCHGFEAETAAHNHLDSMQAFLEVAETAEASVEHVKGALAGEAGAEVEEGVEEVVEGGEGGLGVRLWKEEETKRRRKGKI